jgi:small subunit ribosomal protein SAe
MAAAAAGGGGGGAPRALSQREQDIQMMLAADVHLGTKNCDFQMERYVYKRRSDGTIRASPSLPSKPHPLAYRSYLF